LDTKFFTQYIQELECQIMGGLILVSPID